MLFTVKERHNEVLKKEETPSFKEILKYLKQNKYLFILLVAMFLFGVSSVEQKMAIYMGRICLNNESAATLVAAGVAVAVIVVSIIIPGLSKKIDKFNLLLIGVGFSVLMDVVCFFVGYSNFVVALILIMLKCSGLGFWQVIIYMLIADTVEYGTYKSKTRAAGVTFSLQTFIAKLKNGLIGSIILFSLASIGFIEGENAIQPQGVAQGVWGLFCLLPAVGFTIAGVILYFFYKLRTEDVKIMSQFNNGEISKEEAEKLLEKKFGKAGE